MISWLLLLYSQPSCLSLAPTGAPASGDHPEYVLGAGPSGGRLRLGRGRPAEDQQGAGEAPGLRRRVCVLGISRNVTRERLRAQSPGIPSQRGAATDSASTEQWPKGRQGGVARCQSQKFGPFPLPTSTVDKQGDTSVLSSDLTLSPES